jgi:hypothetical protein
MIIDQAHDRTHLDFQSIQSSNNISIQTEPGFHAPAFQCHQALFSAFAVALGLVPKPPETVLPNAVILFPHRLPPPNSVCVFTDGSHNSVPGLCLFAWVGVGRILVPDVPWAAEFPCPREVLAQFPSSPLPPKKDGVRHGAPHYRSPRQYLIFQDSVPLGPVSSNIAELRALTLH